MSKFPFKGPPKNAAPLQNYFEGLLQNQERQSIVHTMTKGGKDLQEILPKTHLLDENMAKAIALARQDIIEFELGDELMDMLTTYCNALNSVEGRSRYEALMGASGVVDSNYWRSKQEEKKNGRRHKHIQRKEPSEDDDE